MPRGGARPGAGRPRKAASTAALSLRKRVAIAAAAGMHHNDIAVALGISMQMLSTRYAAELSRGAFQCRLEIFSALYRCALAGSVAAARFYLKNATTLSPPPLGKKSAAAKAAVGAQDGTDWANLLSTNRTRQ